MNQRNLIGKVCLTKITVPRTGRVIALEDEIVGERVADEICRLKTVRDTVLPSIQRGGNVSVFQTVHAERHVDTDRMVWSKGECLGHINTWRQEHDVPIPPHPRLEMPPAMPPKQRFVGLQQGEWVRWRQFGVHYLVPQNARAAARDTIVSTSFDLTKNGMTRVWRRADQPPVVDAAYNKLTYTAQAALKNMFSFFLDARRPASLILSGAAVAELREAGLIEVDTEFEPAGVRSRVERWLLTDDGVAVWEYAQAVRSTERLAFARRFKGEKGIRTLL